MFWHDCLCVQVKNRTENIAILRRKTYFIPSYVASFFRFILSYILKKTNFWLVTRHVFTIKYNSKRRWASQSLKLEETWAKYYLSYRTPRGTYKKTNFWLVTRHIFTIKYNTKRRWASQSLKLEETWAKYLLSIVSYS